MTKQEKLLWIFLASMLVLLFLLSSTDLIIKEKKTDVYPISVIIGDTSEEYYGNFRKGADQAAVEYNVDVSFISLYEKGDARGQIDLVKREIDDGASAVVLTPVVPVECAKMLDEMVINSPLVIIGNRFPNDQVHCGIAQDYTEEGKMLGRAIVSERSNTLPVWIFSKRLDYGYGRERYDGLTSVLTEAGFQWTLYEKQDEDTFRQTIEGTVYPGSGEAVIAALDPESLNGAADIITGSPVYADYITGLYGIGSTTKLLNQLDSGIISGMVVSDQFDTGYLSVVRAVEAAARGLKRDQVILDSYYIEKEDLRNSRLEKILYPIE